MEIFTPFSSVVVALLVILFMKKRKAKDSKPNGESTTTSHGNPTYGFSDFQQEKNAEDNTYEQSPSACGKDQEDMPEQFYANIGYDTTDDAIYDYVELPERRDNKRSFINPGYASDC